MSHAETPAPIDPRWDYSLQAEYYRYRPNYAPAALMHLVAQVDARRRGFVTADVGAGTGNLSKLLVEQGVRPVVAIEPNQEMRRRGQEATRGEPVVWVDGTGEVTHLADEAVDWFAMGSSFNTTDRPRCLAEAQRVLRAGGWFTCLWNHRELERDEAQARVEAVIRRHVPGYTHGTRREDQTAVIVDSGRFDPPSLLEVEQEVTRTLDEYLLAWRSVKNPHWDLSTPAGQALFEAICADVRAELGPHSELRMVYTTRAWTAQVRK